MLKGSKLEEGIKMNKVEWLGHATFQITTSEGTRILIDPWISENPSSPVHLDDLKDPHLVLITHDHFDHLGDVGEVASLAMTIGQPELIGYLKDEYGLKEENTTGMNTGGTVEVKGIQITMVQAFHSSSHGSPTGFIITLEDGKTIYHAGDTAIYSSMELYGSLYPLDLALLPVGGFFTMDPLQAAKAVELLRPKVVIPMHYKTFPVLVQEANSFADLVKQGSSTAEVVILEPGESWEL